jgi:thiaminase
MDENSNKVTTTDHHGINERVDEIYDDLVAKIDREPTIQAMLSGSLTREAYIRWLQQSYHYVRWTSIWLHQAARRSTNSTIREALAVKAGEESGHEQWILHDLANLGVQTPVPDSWPICPGVAAYIAWLRFEVEDGQPEAILGAAYVLERLSEHYAGRAAKRMTRAGFRSDVLLFMAAHGEADVGHIFELTTLLHQIDDEEVARSIVLAASMTAKAYLNLLKSMR